MIRGGEERQVPAEELVPGDLILLREGDRVPADARLTSTRGLAVDESALTGESIPADKGIEPIADGAGLAERSSMVFAGTGVTRGRARALVTATGPQAEIGRVAELTRRSKPPPTPLQRRLGTLSRLMVGAGVLITVGLAGIRLLQGAPAEQAFLLGVSVAVAAVPEGLAATVTVALALGARRMAARGAIVRRLVAAETLGSATVVASDKTGTLTQNRLRVRAVAPSASRDENEVLEAAVLASTAELVERDGELEVAGDPVEGALLLAARKTGHLAGRPAARAPACAGAAVRGRQQADDAGLGGERHSARIHQGSARGRAGALPRLRRRATQAAGPRGPLGRPRTTRARAGQAQRRLSRRPP